MPKRGKTVESITRSRRGITVAPSPFNKVKFELGVIVVVLPLVWLVVGRLLPNLLAQLAALFVLGSGAALWLVWRTRATLRRLEGEREHGAQQE